LSRPSLLDHPPPHRPEVLMLSFLGTFVKPLGRPPIPARVFIDVLDELGVTEGATRRALARMTHKDLLLAQPSGRNRLFTPSARALALLANGAERVAAEEPFKHPEPVWTLLAFTMPETRRDIRHQLRSRLLWAGFGPLRDGLWIAPGAVDAEALLADLGLGTEGQLPWAFTADPIRPTELPSLIRRVWDVDHIHDEHQHFLDRWANGIPENLGPMAARTLLVADWLRLLRTDPGLPAEYLCDDWPAKRSASTYRYTIEELRQPSEHELTETLLAQVSGRSNTPLGKPALA
jgi:DNA-binding transcriptional regulator PaaX